MLEPKTLDDLARRLAESMPEGVRVLREDLSRGFRSTLESGLGRLDLVTREEFDVQAAVLARTRAKLEALAARVAALEDLAAATARAVPAADTGSADKASAKQTAAKKTATKKPAADGKQPPASD
jgi:BMFP domain-containing protein YqiC